MLCDHQLVSNYLYDYIDEKLSPQIKKQIEQALEQCENCQASYQQAIKLHQASHQWQQQPVPNWHRTEYAVRPKSRGSSWLSWSALATSTLAILMVVFQVQINTNDSGLHIAFGEKSNAQINLLIEERLLDFQQKQTKELNARFVAESNKQNTTNKLMMAELIEKTRDERRDDLNFLVTGIQTQRFEDQQKVDKHLTYLAENQIENNEYINQLIQSANLNKGNNR